MTQLDGGQSDKQAANKKHHRHHHHHHHHRDHWLVKTVALNYLRALARCALLTLTLQCILAPEVAATAPTLAPRETLGAPIAAKGHIKLPSGDPKWAERQPSTRSSAPGEAHEPTISGKSSELRSPPSPAAALGSPAPARGGGQLEAFSIDWTGLGDLEASDALKKMTRRRRADYTMAAGWIPSLGKRQAKLYALRPIDELTRRANSDLPMEPIFVSRRTEDLLENLSPQDSLDTLGAASGSSDKETFPLLGEFGSKISLLTTRKIEPKALFYRGPIGVAVEGSQATGNWLPRRWVVAEQALEDSEQQSTTIPVSVGGRRNQAMVGGDDAADDATSHFRLDGRQPEAVSIMESLGTNYLPRIARKSFM